MKISGALRNPAILAAALFAAAGHAQESTTDEWPGELKRKGGSGDIKLLVKYTETSPQIKNLMYNGAPFDIERQDFAGDKLSFTWKPGKDDFDCRLELDDGKFVGECTADDSRHKIQMWIKPSGDLSWLSGGGASPDADADAEQGEDQDQKDNN